MSYVLGLGLALALSWTMEASATVKSRMVFAATVYLQGPDRTVGDWYIGTLAPLRVTTKDLLDLAAELQGRTWPLGAYIEVDPDGPVTVKTNNVVIADITQIIAVTFDFDGDLFSGAYNDVTQAEASLILLPFELTVNAPSIGTRVDASGVAFERFAATAVRNGQQIAAGSIVVSISGSGMIDNGPALLIGRVSLVGRETWTYP